jgi:hypothetical protein
VSIIGKNSLKKGSKNGFFMVMLFWDFLGFLKLKMVIHATKKKIKSRVSKNRITMAFFENPFFL